MCILTTLSTAEGIDVDVKGLHWKFIVKQRKVKGQCWG